MSADCSPESAIETGTNSSGESFTSVRVEFPLQQRADVVAFPTSFSVRDCVEQLLKDQKKPPAQADTHGLLHIPCSTQDGGAHGGLEGGVWLPPTAQLSTCDVSPKDRLLFKCKTRPVRLVLPDGSQRTFMLDDAEPVRGLVEYVASKLSLHPWIEYSLQFEHSPPYEWLNEHKSLRENGVQHTASLYFRRKYFVLDDVLSSSTTSDCEISALFESYTFLEAKRYVHECPYFHLESNQAIRLAVLELAVVHESVEAIGDEEVLNAIPERLRDTMESQLWIKEIRPLLKNVASVGKSVAELRAMYTQYSASQQMYGVTFFPASDHVSDPAPGTAGGSRKLSGLFLKRRNSKGQQHEGDNEAAMNLLVGISKRGVFRMNASTGEIIGPVLALASLKRWAYSTRTFTVQHDSLDHLYTIRTDYGEEMKEMLQQYVNLLIAKGSMSRQPSSASTPAPSASTHDGHRRSLRVSGGEESVSDVREAEDAIRKREEQAPRSPRKPKQLDAEVNSDSEGDRHRFGSKARAFLKQNARFTPDQNRVGSAEQRRSSMPDVRKTTPKGNEGEVEEGKDSNGTVDTSSDTELEIAKLRIEELEGVVVARDLEIELLRERLELARTQARNACFAYNWSLNGAKGSQADAQEESALIDARYAAYRALVQQRVGEYYKQQDHQLKEWESAVDKRLQLGVGKNVKSGVLVHSKPPTPITSASKDDAINSSRVEQLKASLNRMRSSSYKM